MTIARYAAFAAFLCCSLAFNAHSQNAISVGEVLFNGSPITNDSITTSLAPGELEFRLRIQVDSGVNQRLGGTTNGFEIYSTGPSWDTTEADFLPVWLNPPINFDLVRQAAEYSSTGQNDTVGFNNSVIFGDGAPPGFDEIAWSIKLKGSFNDAFIDQQVCIDSVSFYAPSTLNWIWNDLDSEVFPSWTGPYCVTFVEPSVGVPFITNAPFTIAGSHCSALTFDFDAIDPQGDPFIFEIVSGPGQINAQTGVWTWTPSLGDVGTAIELVVAANDGQQGVPSAVNIVPENAAPVTTNCPSGPITVSNGQTRTVDLEAEDSCPGDPQLWSIVDDGGAVGPLGIDANGVLTFTPDDPDDFINSPISVSVEVSDGVAATTCDITFEILAVVNYGVQIEKDEGQTGVGALQGQFTNVDVTMNAAPGPMGAFNFLIAYDPTALNFSGIETEGSQLFEDCDWEYLQYRLGPFGNCVGACPSGMVRIVGIAETNNGADHPVIGCDPTGKMFSLRFLVSNDRTLECQYVPVRFYWFECGDNTLSSEFGDTLFLSSSVHDYNGINPQDPWSEDIGPAFGFPTWQGHPDICVTNPGPGKPQPQRLIDFYNGGVDIVCANEIDARADINLDGLAYTIADAVMLTNYFIYGMQVFAALPGQPLSTQAAIAASDVNADGLTLTVSDLVYLIRVVVGDAAPFPKVTPVNATCSIAADGTVSVDTELGAAYLAYEGDITPELLAGNMTMEHAFDADDNITRVIIYSGPEASERATFEGPFIRAGADLVTIDMAKYDGTPVTAIVSDLLPAGFALAQNYPNPFNPSTTIEFSLPVRSEYKLTIYNVQGQQLETFEGVADAGVEQVTWDAAPYSSGVYLYKLTAGSFTESRKMVLLK